MSTRLFTFLRYLILFSICGMIAAAPWVLSAINPPLPFDFRVTATALSATRTARLIPPETWTAYTQEALAKLPTATLTQTPSPTPTPTQTTTPVPSATFTNAPTPTPPILGSATATINTYSCPAAEFRVGQLSEGTIFTVLGWDETFDGGKSLLWILIEDRAGQPQVWIRDSQFLIISVPNYVDLVPRASCRTTR